MIIASWNAATFLPRAISSALGQQNVTLEIIVCDDASVDDTEKLMLEISDHRVRYIRFDVNSGPAAARNAGLAAARGEWIIILDADDLIDPDRAWRLIKLARETDADILADNLQIVLCDGQPCGFLIEETLDGSCEKIDLENYILRNLSGRYGLGYLKPMLRRRFLVDHGILYRHDLRIGEDFALICDMLTSNARFFRVKMARYRYTVHRGSVSHRISARHLDAMIRYDCDWLEQNKGFAPSGAYAAMTLHLNDLTGLRAFTGMVYDIQEMKFWSFIRSAWRHPTALGHFKGPFLARIQRLQARWSKKVRHEEQTGAIS